MNKFIKTPSIIIPIFITLTGCGEANAAINWTAPNITVLQNMLNNKTHKFGNNIVFYTNSKVRAHLKGNILREKKTYSLNPKGSVCYSVNSQKKCATYQVSGNKTRVSTNNGTTFTNVRITNGVPRYVSVPESARLNRSQIIKTLTNATLIESHKKYKYTGKYTHAGTKGWHVGRSVSTGSGKVYNDEGPWKANAKNEYCSAWKKWSKGKYTCFSMYLVGNNVTRVVVNSNSVGTSAKDPAYYYKLIR